MYDRNGNGNYFILHFGILVVVVVFVRSLLIVVGKEGHLFSGLQLALHVPSGQWGRTAGGREAGFSINLPGLIYA